MTEETGNLPSCAEGMSAANEPKSPDQSPDVAGLRQFDAGTTDVQSRYVIVHQLRASADIQSAAITRNMGRPATTDRAELMRRAADVIERLALIPTANVQGLSATGVDASQTPDLGGKAGLWGATERLKDLLADLEEEPGLPLMLAASVCAEAASDLRTVLSALTAPQQLAGEPSPAQGKVSEHEAQALCEAFCDADPRDDGTGFAWPYTTLSERRQWVAVATAAKALYAPAHQPAEKPAPIQGGGDTPCPTSTARTTTRR